jgi:hypothetical protein
VWNPFRKKEDRLPSYTFLEEDRGLSLEIRRSKSEIAKQKQQLELEVMKLEAERTKLQLQAEIEEARQRIQDMTEDSETSHGSNPADVMMMALLSKVMGGNAAPVAPSGLPPSPINNHEAPRENYSDEQIQQLWNNVPKEIKKIARGMSEEQIGDFVSKQMPQVDSDTRTRIIMKAKRG